MANPNIQHSVASAHDEEARRQGRVVFVANLNYEATRRDFVETLLELGFNNVTLCWPDAAAPDAKLTKSWCRLLFEDLAIADRTKFELDGADFRGRPMWVGNAYPIRDSRSSPAAPASSATPSLSAAPSSSVKFNPAAMKYPDSWRFDIGDPDAYRDAFMKDHAALDAWYRRKNVKNRFLYGADANGESKFYARQYHSQGGVRDPDVAMVKKSTGDGSNGSRQFKKVPMSAIRADDAWQPWSHPRKPTSLQLPGLDRRQLGRVRDAISLDAPWKDSKYIFPRGIEIANVKSAKPWVEGVIPHYLGKSRRCPLLTHVVRRLYRIPLTLQRRSAMHSSTNAHPTLAWAGVILTGFRCGKLAGAKSWRG